MKTQMQIIQEAIDRLEGMSADEFRESLLKAGAVEISKILNLSGETVSLTGTPEEKAKKTYGDV